MPHHLRNNEDGPGNFREGIVLDKECRKEGHSLVGVGTRKDVIVAKTITPGVRVTVKLARSLEDDALDDKKNIKGKIKAIDLLLFRKFGVSYFTFIALHFAGKFFNEHQTFGLKWKE